MKAETLIVILGPTASGKTEMAIRIAKLFDTVIISADSRQFYREIPIGTAMPTPIQLSEVRHYFIGHKSIKDTYTVADYEKDALQLIKKLFTEQPTLVMTGGSGLFIRAVCEGLDDMPAGDPQIRSQLNDIHNKKGISVLQKMLKKEDPEYYHMVDRNNPARLIRALEVIRQTSRTYSSFRGHQTKKRPFRIIKIGLQIEREALARRISQRVDQMMDAGLLQEVQRVYPDKGLNALNTLGYKELFEYLDGHMSLQQSVEQIKSHTKQYAKRQMTWFRKEKNIVWFPYDAHQQIADYLRNEIASN